MGKVVRMLLLCAAITLMAAGASAWHDIPKSVVVAKETSIDNSHLHQLIQLWTRSIEKGLIKSLHSIHLQKKPKANNDKMDDEDVDEWVNNNRLSFGRNRRIKGGLGYLQRWGHLLRLD